MGKGKLEVYNYGDGLQSSLKRDPSGRLQRFSKYQKGGKKFTAGYFNTAQPATKANLFGTQPGYHPTYYVTDTKTHPSNIFYTFVDGKKETQTIGKTYDKKKQKMNATEYPVLEFAFYGSNKCQLHDYGRILIAQDTQEPVSKGEQEEVLIGGYFDAPIPFPLVNFVGQELSNNELELGTFSYKTKEDKDKESGLETGWTLGFESDGKTTKGLGPAYKVSVECGMSSVEKDSISSELEIELPVTATVKSYGDSTKPYAEASGVVSIVNARLIITGYQFFDNQGHLVNDALSGDKAQSPKIGAALTRMTQTDSTHYTFEPFNVEPGNLESYTAPAINAEMKKLGYSGSNYFGDVISKNAYPIGGLNPYLVLTWDMGNPNKVDTFQTKSSFKEQSWKFDTSLYGGISGGGGIDFFGMGEEFEFSFMAGGSYSRDRSVSNLVSSGWGVGISEKWGPIVPGNDTIVKDWVRSYSFRMYFLPVPKSPSTLPHNYWTTEFTNSLAPKALVNSDGIENNRKIDPNSGSWRILFVVTEIEYAEGSKKKDYRHDKDLDERSVYS